jgi:lipoteichoic acid synthase
MNKKIVLKIVLICMMFCGYAQRPVDQKIRFVNEGATEVFMVWGVNNWQPLEQEKLPARSYVKDGLIYTQMRTDAEGVFNVNLWLNAGTRVDYVFWITKGPLGVPCDIWDVNSEFKEDYHTVVFNNNVTQIESKVLVKPKQQVSILNYSGKILMITLIMAAIALFVKTIFLRNISLNPGPRKIILGSAGIILATLFITRASVSLLGWDLYYHPLDNLSQFLWNGFYDHLYVLVLTGIFMLLLFVFRKYTRIKQVIIGTFFVIGLFSIIAAILNIRVVEMIGKPFNFRWFYYSGFLNSSDSKAAMSENISANYVLDVVAVCLAAIIAGTLVVYAVEFILERYKVKRLALAAFICLNAGYVFLAQSAVEKEKKNYDKLANPVTAFLESVNPFASDPDLYTMEVPDSLRTFAKINADTSGLKINYSDKIKNVIVLVLESTAAEYVQPYDRTYKITPELGKQLSNAIVFNNMYAHAPATNKSMVSLLGSIYPWISYASITQEYPGIQIPSLSSELKSHGYRTAFFNSGDNDFQKAGEFLSYRQFDEIWDCKTLSCDKKFEEKNSKEALNGANDECTVKAMLSWINKNKKEPFFSMMWTYQTHYPYYASDTLKRYAQHDTVLNRYLNAVNHSDKVLGMIINELKKKKLDKSTLLVVIGDHGEAFGEHDQITHASKIYEENVHIPMILINPAFTPQTLEQLGGMVDVAPTVMSILGLPVTDKWQGQNLFANVKNKRVYFFCPWSDYLFGYREGNKKYIYNASSDVTEIYDLKKDPGETCNIAEDDAQAQLCHQKLAAWVQYQNKFIKETLKQKAELVTSSRKTEH